LRTRHWRGTGNYLIAGRNWKGEAPKGMEILHSPTDIVWVLGRIQTDGTADYDFVHTLQDQIKLVPLSKWGQSYSPPNGKVNPKVDMKKAPMSVLDDMNGETFFTALAEAMKKNPPHIHDQGLVERMKRLGFEPGKSLDFKSLPPPVQQALNDATGAELKVIRERSERLGSAVNGWNVLSGAIGYFGADYLVRAATGLVVLAANRPEDAVYSIGEPLSGKNRYVLRFPKGQTPPVTGFWSITLYDEQGFAVENALQRYAIGDRDHLKFDEATIRLIGEKGAWLSTQPFETGDEPLPPENLAKARSIFGAWERILQWAKTYNVHVAFGTDLIFSGTGTSRENLMLTRLARVYSNVEVLKIATSGNCALFAMSGERNPYKAAKLGVLQEGAWADMLLVDGDPTVDIDLLAGPERNFVVIIKNGDIFKDTLYVANTAQ
jgi:Protein of unknown function (DUF1254)/Protein of unknown function (DUF1214)